MLLQFLAAAGVLALLTLVPGPDMAVVTRQAVSHGWRNGLWTVAGISAGCLAWGALTVAGLAAVLAASATAYTVVKLAGAAYLVVLGVQAIVRSRRHAEPPDAVPDRPAAATHPLRTGLVTNLLNPKIAVFYTGLLPALAPRAVEPHLGMALLVLIHVALGLVWLGGYVLLLARARAFFERPAVRRATERVTGAVLIAFAVKVAAAHD